VAFFFVVVVAAAAAVVSSAAPHAPPKRRASPSLETVLTGFLGDLSNFTSWSCAK
jgi:hypothetical protein